MFVEAAILGAQGEVLQEFTMNYVAIPVP